MTQTVAYNNGTGPSWAKIRDELDGPETDEDGNTLADLGARLLAERVRSGAWLDAQVFPPLEWAVPGLIPEGFGLLTGPPKAGKSWFTLGVLLAIATSTPALGCIPTEARPVLYLALEDGHRRMQRRARQLADEIPAGFDYITEARPEEVVPLIRAWLDTHPKGVVVIDTLAIVLPSTRAGQSAYSRDYEIGREFKAIVSDYPGTTLFAVHHTRKAEAADWMDTTSGTNGLNGAADWTLNLERQRGTENAVVRVTGRDVPEGEYAARVTEGRWALAGNDLPEAARALETATATERLGDRLAAVVEYVTAAPGDVRAADVAEHLGHLGIDSASAGTYLGRAAKGGLIRRAARGAYRSLNTSNTDEIESVESVESVGSQEPRPNETPSAFTASQVLEVLKPTPQPAEGQ